MLQNILSGAQYSVHICNRNRELLLTNCHIWEKWGTA